MCRNVVRELGMQKDNMKRQEWTKPRLNRLGEIKDVAQSPGPPIQNASKT